LKISRADIMVPGFTASWHGNEVVKLANLSRSDHGSIDRGEFLPGLRLLSIVGYNNIDPTVRRRTSN
jgi:hypothetical protein